MQDRRFLIESISPDKLKKFIDDYQPTFDFPNIKEVYNRTLELAFDSEDESFTNVIHTCYDMQEEKYCAILNIGTTKALADYTSIAVEFLYIEPEYRKVKFEELNNQELSQYLLLDYVVGNIGFQTKSNIGISMIALSPIDDKVRTRYEEIGFDSIEESGSNKFEDWMYFSY